MDIATRYAKALAATMDKQEAAEQLAVYECMRQLADVMAEEKSLTLALQSNKVADEKKLQLLCTAAGEPREDSWLQRFFGLLIGHHREALARNIALIYLHLYRQSHGITDVRVETAAPMDMQVRQRLEAHLEKKLGGRVECTYKTTPELIGGVRVQMGDKLIDASYAAQLETLRLRLQDL